MLKKNRKETMTSNSLNRSVGMLSLPHASQPPLPRAERGVCTTGVQVPHQPAHPLFLQNLQEDTQVPATVANVITTDTAGRHQLIHQPPHLLRLCVQILVVVKKMGGWMSKK